MRDASATPWIANDPRWPRYTSFRYISRISSFDARRSSASAIMISRTFRQRDPQVRRDRAVADRGVVAVPDVADGGGEVPDRTDADMRVEALILDRHHRLPHPHRDRVQRHAP